MHPTISYALRRSPLSPFFPACSCLRLILISFPACSRFVLSTFPPPIRIAGREPHDDLKVPAVRDSRVSDVAQGRPYRR